MLRKAAVMLSAELGVLRSEGAAVGEKRCRRTEAEGAGPACGAEDRTLCALPVVLEFKVWRHC